MKYENKGMIKETQWKGKLVEYNDTEMSKQRNGERLIITENWGNRITVKGYDTGITVLWNGKIIEWSD